MGFPTTLKTPIDIYISLVSLSSMTTIGDYDYDYDYYHDWRQNIYSEFYLI